MSDEAPIRQSKPPRSRRVLFLLSVASAVAIAAAAFGIVDRAKSTQEVADWSNEQAVATVRLIQPQRGGTEEQLVLPGTVNAFYTGSLFARASGYITSWDKDIGAHVTKGEILATISAPDLDQQLEEARAQLVQLNAGL